MSEYPSIENLYAAEKDAKGRPFARGPKQGFQRPEFAQIGQWLVTEKVDGMSIRVIFDQDPGSTGPSPEPPSSSVRFAGRSDNAAIHPQLFEHLQRTFTLEKLWDAFKINQAEEGDETPYWTCPSVVLFGEGFGPGIQKAGVAYGGEKRFILFDVLVDGKWWLSWENVENVAAKLDIPTVPVLAQGVSLATAKMFVRTSELLPVGSEHIEGIVLRTDPYLFNNRGQRIVAKYKVRDLSVEDEQELGEVTVGPLLGHEALSFDFFS